MPTHISFRVPEELMQQLKEKAKEENRTLSNVIITILKAYFK